MTLADRMRRSLPRSPSPALRALVALESIAREYGPGLARRKRALLGRLERAALPSAAAVHRLHETASFLIAYPDAAGVHRTSARLLGGFSERRDLRRFAPQLVGPAGAGTALAFGVFSPMAPRVGARGPGRPARPAAGALHALTRAAALP